MARMPSLLWELSAFIAVPTIYLSRAQDYVHAFTAARIIAG